MSVTKICEMCGKEFTVIPCRANTAKYCSRVCSDKAKHGPDNVTCTQCGKKFHMKQYQIDRYDRNHGFFCSKECYAEFKKEAMKGEKNHQYGLKGELNASFKRGILTKRNGHLKEEMLYVGERPDADKNGRMTKHRHLVVTNPKKFHSCLFNQMDKFILLKPNLQVHHIDWDHSNNVLENLSILEQGIHSKVHTQIKELSIELLAKIIGVFKGGELLETLEVDNQQPSLSSNTLEGSETNARFQIKTLESNSDTSALLNQIIKLINDYIVQAKKITDDGYKQTITKILESEIKSSEVIQNELCRGDKA